MKALKVIFLLFLAASIQCEEIEFEDNIEPMTVIAIINCIAKAWSVIAKTFSTTKTSTFKELLVGQGFDYYKGRTLTVVGNGVKENYFEKYIRKQLSTFHLPVEKFEDFLETMMQADYSDATAWTGFEVTYNQDSVNNNLVSYGNLQFHRRETKEGETGKIDVLMAFTIADFQLAPNVMVFTETKSVAGGIYSRQRDIYKEVPRSLTRDELEVITTFFQMLGLKSLCQLLGYGDKVEFPKLG